MVYKFWPASSPIKTFTMPGNAMWGRDRSAPESSWKDWMLCRAYLAREPGKLFFGQLPCAFAHLSKKLITMFFLVQLIRTSYKLFHNIGARLHRNPRVPLASVSSRLFPSIVSMAVGVLCDALMKSRLHPKTLHPAPCVQLAIGTIAVPISRQTPEHGVVVAT